MSYVLAPRAIEARARALAAWAAIRAAAPALLVVGLLVEMQLAFTWTWVIAALVGVLAVVRAATELSAARRRLRSLAVDVDDEGLTVHTPRGPTRVPRASIVGASEIGGPLGGLRLQLVPTGDLPSRLDLPRGGDGFGDLRAHVGAWVPVARARRRGRVARVLVAVAIVAAMFFVPFVLADAKSSRVAVTAVLLLAWGAMRFAFAR